MSFRSRLLFLFTITVIVPMVAVALVLFGVVANSENGKADATLAQALRTTFSVYQTDRAKAAPLAARAASDPPLVAALRHGDGAALATRLAEFARMDAAVRSITVTSSSGSPMVSVGARDAVAAAVAAPGLKGRRLGYVALSTTSASEFTKTAKQLSGLDVSVVIGGRVAGSTIDGAFGSVPRSGNVTVGGHGYRARFTTLPDATGRQLAVGVLMPSAPLSNEIKDRRILILGILAGFLLLVMLAAGGVVRALQRQIAEFLSAARRLAHGDFTRPVPVDGSDEFAQLADEFNAMSLQLASKIEEVQRKRGELEDTIRRVGEAFAASLDRQEMVNIAVRTAIEACEAETGRALPIDARRMKTASIGSDDPRLKAALEAAERRAFEIHIDDARDWVAALDGQETEEESDKRRPVRAHADGYYALAVPLMAKLARSNALEQVGVVSIARAGSDFDDSEYELFAYLIRQAAVSIENLDLHERVRVQAVTDELTGLANMRHFQEALDGELERTRRFGAGVGLLMLDIDDFKQINDTLGHQQGDLVLAEIGKVLSGLSRDIDLAARYGGEEMAVILPETGVEGAGLLAERMRKAIASLEIDRLDGEGAISVTASFGVASVPESASDKRELIKAADLALYLAKREGKNRVERAVSLAAHR